jgi:hypothetical protein
VEKRGRNRGGGEKKEEEGAAAGASPRHGLDCSLHQIAAAPSTSTSSPTGERRRLASLAFPCFGVPWAAVEPPVASPRSPVPFVCAPASAPRRFAVVARNRHRRTPVLALPCHAWPRCGSGDLDARARVHSHRQAAKKMPLVALVGPSLIRTAGEPRCRRGCRPFTTVPAVEFRCGLATLDLPVCAF